MPRFHRYAVKLALIFNVMCLSESESGAQVYTIRSDRTSLVFVPNVGTAPSHHVLLTPSNHADFTAPAQASIALPSVTSAQTMVWLAPRDYISYVGYPGTPDFMQLFVPGAPWPVSAKATQVFQLNELFVNSTTDQDLKTILTNLKSRHIAVAMEAGMLTDYAMCLAHIEGYRCSNIGSSLTRVQRLGGTVDYIAMDEPLLFGHLTPIYGVVHKPISTVAAMVAVNVAAARQIFPNIKIGTTEVLPGSMGPADYMQQLEQFAIAFGEATGKPLDFLHLDVSWTNNGWQTQMQEALTAANAVNMPLGIIYNGNWNDADAVIWIEHAQEHFVTLEKTEHVIPGQAVFQTWNSVPDLALPETKIGTMTNLVANYVKFEESIGKTVMVNP